MPKLELDEAIDLFYKKIKPVLTRVKYLSDNPENFTKEQMGVFLSLVHFVNIYKVKPYFFNKEKVKKFNEFTSDFYKSSRRYFALKIGTGEYSGEFSCEYFVRIGKGCDRCKDIDFILSLSRDKLPIHHLFNLIDFYGSYRSSATNGIKVKCTMVKCTMCDVVAHMSEEKQMEFCNYLFEEYKLGSYLKHFDLMNMRKNRDDLAKMVLRYHNHLTEQNDKKKIQKLKGQVIDYFYNTFVEQIKSNSISYSDNKVYKQFIAEFFVKELVKKDMLIPFLQEADPNKQVADKYYNKKEVQSVYNNMFKNLYDLLDYCSDINTEQVKQEFKNTYIQTCRVQNTIKREELLDTEKYEGLCCQP